MAESFVPDMPPPPPPPPVAIYTRGIPGKRPGCVTLLSLVISLVSILVLLYGALVVFNPDLYKQDDSYECSIMSKRQQKEHCSSVGERFEDAAGTSLKTFGTVLIVVGLTAVLLVYSLWTMRVWSPPLFVVFAIFWSLISFFMLGRIFCIPTLIFILLEIKLGHWLFKNIWRFAR